MAERIALRDAFGEALQQIGAEDDRVVVLDADLATSTRTILFARSFPDRFFQMGIAEQNMVGVAAGLATCGFIPFVTTFGVFASKRVTDQISISVAYPGLNVKIIGAYCGLTAGKVGPTHQAIEDVAIIRSIPNMTVVEPADAGETEQMVRAIVRIKGPVYMRLTREAVPAVNPEGYQFTVGKGVVLLEGEDITLIAAGVMVEKALEAAAILREENIYARVINMSTIKPIDKELVVAAARETGAIVTIENHSIIGGLGSAVAEVLSEMVPVPLLRIGLRDVFSETGDHNQLFKKYRMDVPDIIAAVKKLRAEGGVMAGDKEER